ncbi:MAG TPA: alpha-ribazole phosphatase [Dehalococcoidia bacterium]|nr:alpha-ribazole phosphatase [Dehalococcoidia bacterium]
MLKLYLIRHGQTELNKVRRFQGRIDVPLNETGIGQAQKLALRLSSEPLDKIYTSPLSRAQQTAEIIRSSHQIDIMTNEELVEMSFGSLEGKTYREINEIFPDWNASVFDFTFAGGENLDNLVVRMKSFLDIVKKQDENSNILLVTHSGCLRVILCLLLGIDVNKWWQFKIDVASLTVVDNVTQGAVLTLLNDTSHLNGG